MIKAFKKGWNFMFADLEVFFLSIAGILIVFGATILLISGDKDSLKSQKSDAVNQNTMLLNQTTNLLNMNTILLNSIRR